MKLAIHNPFKGESFAETELAKRISLAATNLGWKAEEVATSIEINNLKPDIVLATHIRTPKLTGYPTYGCMWSPPIWFEQEEILLKNVMSYDAYLSSSDSVNLWIEDLLYCTSKQFIIAPFYTSCNATPYQPPNLQNPHLVYIGSNWDGPRFKDLFLKLDHQDYMEVYGNEAGWQYLQSSYKGTLPFNGIHVLKSLNQAGVGLCLHRDEHSEWHIPSMRIFEIVASGAIALCSEHPFIREHFGDTVLYFSSHSTVDEKIQQISESLQWIKDNRKEALEMSREAHRIFTHKFTLEKLLTELILYHKKLVVDKGFILPVDADIHQNNNNKALNPSSTKNVEIIVRVGGRGISKIKRTFDSLVSQTYKNIGIVLVKWNEVEGLEQLIKDYQEKIPIRVVEVLNTKCRSTALWAGINAVDADYFGALDDDDVIHPNHIYSLVSLLNEYEDFGVAYSGILHVWEADKEGEVLLDSQPIKEPATLAYFRDFKITEFLFLRNFITTSCFMAKKSLIDKRLSKDPKFHIYEDFFLFLNLSQKTKFIFSYEATCELYLRASQQDNSIFENRQEWDETAKRIEKIMWNQEFPSRQTMGDFKLMQVELETLRTQLQQRQGELEQTRLQLQQMQGALGQSHSQLQQAHFQLQQAQSTIAAMESSKFWKLRKAWFHFKQKIGLLANE
jgi:GT2 family glycosyltransferase